MNLCNTWNFVSVLSFLWPPKIHFHLTCIHSTHPNVFKWLNTIIESTQSSKISSKSYQLKSPKLHHPNQVWVRPELWSILGQNSFPSWASETRKQDIYSQNATVGQAQYTSYRHSCSEWEKIEEKNSHLSQAILKSICEYYRCQGLEIIPCSSWLCSLNL